MQLWSKTILSVYKYLERITNSIDKIVVSRAINSYFTSGSNLSFNDVRNVSDDILNLTERKITLINLKLITEKALELTDEKYSKILILSFVEKRTCYECSEILGISLRTFFRKIKTALQSFEKTLLREGHNLDFFEDMLKDEAWIIEVKNRFKNKKQEDFKLDKKFENKIHMDFKKISPSKSRVNLQTHNNLTF